ncbi:MAG: aldo/keto reductase [Gammaproteobacteria bacterium]|nr:aldo/keto reductase [Gammaproteobacteria bacterium]
MAGRVDELASANQGAAAAGVLRLGGDLAVARMGYGAMRITGNGVWGEPADPARCRAVLRRALDLGINFIDSADSYGPFVSERLIAEALYPYPQGLVIATKGGSMRSGPDGWTANGQPEHLRAACEGSLQRLRIERIDLYQLHIPDPRVPYEESIGELVRLKDEGKIRHIGVSNVTPGQLAIARSVAPIVSVQNRYNVSDRGSDEILAICEEDDLAFIPWAPLGRSGRSSTPDTGAMARLEAVAGERSISIFQAQLAWLLSRSPAMLPIPGTTSLINLEENVAAARLRLSVEEMQRIG